MSLNLSSSFSKLSVVNQHQNIELHSTTVNTPQQLLDKSITRPSEGFDAISKGVLLTSYTTKESAVGTACVPSQNKSPCGTHTRSVLFPCPWLGLVCLFPWPELLSRPSPSLTTHLPSFWPMSKPRWTHPQSLAQAALCLEASSPRPSLDWLQVIRVLLKCRLPT